MSDERPASSNDPLDAMLAQARWPEAKLDAHARLVDAYRARRSRGSRQAMFLRGAVALAANVVIVFGVARFVRVDQPTPLRLAYRPVMLEKEVPLVVRPPTPLEKAIIATQRPVVRKREPAVPLVQNRPVQLDFSDVSRELNKPDLPTDRRQILLVQLLNDGSAAAVRLFLDSVARGATREVSLAALDGATDKPIERLMAALRDPLVDRRIAAARALGYIDGPVLTSRLIRMAENNESRREAMIALACSRGEAAQRYVDRAAQSGSMVALAKSVRVQFEVQ